MGKTFILSEAVYEELKDTAYHCGYPHTSDDDLSTRLYRILDSCQGNNGSYTISDLLPIEEDCIKSLLDVMDLWVQDHREEQPNIYRIEG